MIAAILIAAAALTGAFVAGGISQCEIHALRPIRVDDERTRVLGHEFLHCLIGYYH